MSDLYFNERRWMQLLDNDTQAVRFLAELYRRAGSAEPPTYTLDQTVEQITNIDNSTTQVTLGSDRLRRAVGDLLAGLARDHLLLQSELKRLKHRITELENAQ